ncbi:Ulp1 protease family [Forsythia ovata]|uniref:Ulp1 protease family n=1 Tax=Forsythia ovata TaxID=205694 RepID=A0ABD1W712_9LAMI
MRRSVRQKDTRKNPKVVLRRRKRKAVATLEVEEKLQEMRVKKPSQWLSSPYITEGQWRKHVDATTVDLLETRSHWYDVEVNIAKSTIFIYDPDRSCSTDDQIRADLKPMTKILRMLMNKINIVIDALAIERITTTSKQSNS